MDDVISYLKDNIRYYRSKINISQQKLAEMCDVSTYYISEIEQGKKYPSLKTLIKFANVFNIPVYMLLINPTEKKSYEIERFSTDLSNEISEVIKKLKSKY
ncbi:MAG: helix-turn-helix transcriptional regulator [Spirochaetales bacterium]|nr:helix-turn-helix transcriptional regulator [Spirochaetales bacterium]